MQLEADVSTRNHERLFVECSRGGERTGRGPWAVTSTEGLQLQGASKNTEFEPGLQVKTKVHWSRKADRPYFIEQFVA